MHHISTTLKKELGFNIYMVKFKQWSTYAPMVLRYGMAAVYLWFGINQLFNPANFIGYLPNFIPTSIAVPFVYANGVFEIIAGCLLVAGKFTRVVAALLALHLAAITYELGYGDVAVRDFGLMVATAAIVLNGPDKWSLDKRGKNETA